MPKEKKVELKGKLAECSACKGTGEPTEPEFTGADGKCSYCHGTGKVEVPNK